MKTQNLPVTRAMLTWSAIALIPMFLLSAWAWTKLPEGASMPVHWNAAGQIDRYGSKFEGVMMLPIVTVGLAVLLAGIPLFEPRQSNLLRSAKAYTITGVTALLFMLCLHVMMLMSAFGKIVSVVRVIFGATGILFIVIGNFFGKVRSNYFFGIRTPWTLSSELSWNKTHRLGGWLFVVLGLTLLVATAIAPDSLGVPLLLGGVILITAITMIYSYRVWKTDPHKQMSA